MSVYTDDDRKLYPELPSAPNQQDYRLKKINEIEFFLREEILCRENLSKRFKRRATAMAISDTSVILAITSLEIASVATITSGIGIPVGVALASAGLILGLGSIIVHKSQKIFESKAKKHDKIKTLAESKLDSISSLVSKALEDCSISHEEYQFILKEADHYRSMKQQIRNKSKQVQDAISKEQREVILAQGREQGKEDFLRQIAKSSGIPTAPVM